MTLAGEHLHRDRVTITSEVRKVRYVQRGGDPQQHRQARCLNAPGLNSFQPLGTLAEQAGQHWAGHACAVAELLNPLACG
jgi:hypothetical protein